MINNLWHGFFIAWRIFNDKGILAHASVCGYSTILSMVPIIAISLSMITVFSSHELHTTEHGADGAVSVDQTFSNRVYDFFFDYFVPGAAEGARDELLKAKQDFMLFIQRTAGLRYVILFTLILACVSLFNSIEHAFNEIWSVRYRRTLFTRFIAFWLIITLMPLLLGLSYYYTSQILNSDFIIKLKERAWFTWILPYSISYIFTVFAFFFANYYLPNLKVNFVPAFVGSAVCAILWETAKIVFDLYVTYATVKSQGFYTVFGAYSVIVLFVLWLYYNYLCFLISPVIATTIQDFDVHLSRMKRKRKATEHRPVHSFQILIDICLFMKKEQSGIHPADLAKITGWSFKQIRYCLRDLERAGLIHQARRERLFFPSIPLETISIREITERLLGFVPTTTQPLVDENHYSGLIKQHLHNPDLKLYDLLALIQKETEVLKR